MTVEEFVARRQPAWQELEAGIARARRGSLRELSARDLERFGMLYRRAAGDLAIATRDFADQPVTEYLNGLCTRAHPLLFRGSSPPVTRVLSFYATGLPRAVRAARVYVAWSAGLMLLGVLAGWLAVALRPDLVSQLVPQSVLDGLSQGHLGNTALREVAPIVAAFIIQNNVLVALASLVGGIGLGLPTAYVLVTNGWMLGTLAAAVHQAGYDASFWALIVPHGGIELSVIVLSGAAGLMIGDSLLRPGLLRRMDALTQAGARALVLAVGAAPLLIIAGIIESFVTPGDMAIPGKLLVGVVTATLMWSWLLLAGRARRAGTRPGVDLDVAAGEMSPGPDWSPFRAA